MKILTLTLVLLGLCEQARAVDISSLDYPAKMSLISVCSWSGGIAKSVQLIRQVDGDSFEQYQITATNMLRKELPPEMIQKVLVISEDVYNTVPLATSPTQVFIIYYAECINGFKEEGELAL